MQSQIPKTPAVLPQAWVVRTSALRRTFVSVKGFYFQADVVGQPVTWLVPHALSQVSMLPGWPSCHGPFEMRPHSWHATSFCLWQILTVRQKPQGPLC